MKTQNKVFFASEKGQGITQTSANHIANIAKEYVQEIQNELDAMNLVTSKISLIDSDDCKVLTREISIEEFKLTLQKAERISKFNALIAWLREAIKAKENELNAINALTMYTWADAVGETIDKYPDCVGRTCFEEALGNLSIKDRNTYLLLETKCAVLGKLIHPTGKLSVVRKEHQKRKNAPYTANGTGRDTIVTYYSSNIPSQQVEDTFFELQNQHREYQARFNQMKFGLDEYVRETNTKADEAFALAVKQHNTKSEAQIAAFNAYKENLRNEVGKLKIVIPEELQSTFDELNSIGK